MITFFNRNHRLLCQQILSGMGSAKATENSADEGTDDDEKLMDFINTAIDSEAAKD